MEWITGESNGSGVGGAQGPPQTSMKYGEDNSDPTTGLSDVETFSPIRKG